MFFNNLFGYFAKQPTNIDNFSLLKAVNG